MNSGAVRLMVRLPVTFRGCVNSHFQATNGMEVQYTRLGAFRLKCVQPKQQAYLVLGCAPIGEVYVLGLLKAKQASVHTQTSSTELI